MASDSLASGGVAKRAQKEWSVPTNSSPTPQLYLYNSLTRRKDLFVPNNGNIVKWYICGPTVYDSSHMGHARAYLSMDILRRVMSSYFGYDVQFIMNITDIDDKIIKRARQRHLLTKYLDNSKEPPSVEKIVQDIVSALECFRKKFENETDPDKKKMYESMIARVDASAQHLEKALRSNDKGSIESAKGTLLNEARDVLSDWLDAQFGSAVNDHSVFDTLAKTYESEFLADMARLNVLPADVVTRVSEYVPEIVAYVEKIIKNGYAYPTSDGSVYFDTKAFESNPKHFYAKLVPEAYGDAESLEKNMREGEGELSMSADKLQQKRNPSDFALWKSSKEGEPFWDSPWGKGRPGWHIECSVMSTAICGPKLDIHAGGFDLKFPHHDNEIAQVEAYYDDPHWVNYFIHCGTLRIAGMKMSKSLKNFITIREALRQYSARQLRLLFLMHNWTDVLDYSASTMERAMQFERISNEFFLLVKDILRKHYKPDCPQGYLKYNARELQVMDEFFRIKGEVHEALCDSVDTRTVIEKLRELIGLGNSYIVEKEKEGAIPNCSLLRKIALYVTDLFAVFGVIPKSGEIGFPMESESAIGTEAMLMPYLNALASFREKVRNVAKDNKIIAILEECDRLRDDVLPELGVRLEDRAQETVVKLCDREILLREREQKRAIEEARRLEKERKAAEKAEKEAAKRIPPQEMFCRGDEAKKYSKWDENGIPTHMSDGEEISKKQRKKLEKMWETQQKNYQQAMAAEG
ncbi:cysteine--tRNA ligase [Ancylostoma ceylanicum]|nr:cysteine--tRNA ligase [Ancylostoma ceylanicum]